jgi:lysozyme
MNLSDSGLSVLKFFESLRLIAYQDSAGIWTIGWGHIAGVKPGDMITEDQANEFLAADVAGKVAAINQYLGVKPIGQHQFDAFVVLAFNIGPYGFVASTLWKTFETNGTVTEDMFTRWDKARDPKTHLPVSVHGLTRRRRAEWKLFTTPDTSPVTVATVKQWDDAGLLG